MPLQARIDRYYTHFVGALQAIAASPDKMHRKLLIVSVLDTFGRVLDPKAANKVRFLGLVRAMCDWKEAERVSLPRSRWRSRRHPLPRRARSHARLRSDCGNGTRAE